MAHHFVDTSALVKIYRNEPNTAAVLACLAPNDTLVLSGITILEFESAFFLIVILRSSKWIVGGIDQETKSPISPVAITRY